MTYKLDNMEKLSVADILKKVADGLISTDDAQRLITESTIAGIEDVANIDIGRRNRCGIPEIVLAEGKDTKSLVKIMHELCEVSGRAVASRITDEQAEAVCSNLPKGIAAEKKEGGILILSDGTKPAQSKGCVGIITAGTSDIRVAEEAAAIAEEMGCRVLKYYDAGVAGIHRLIPAIEKLKYADVYVVCAGREGTLPSVVAGLVDKPVIGVPVSTGYGHMGKGEAALSSMLQSCTVITVVNIDAGFTAGAFAARTASLIAGGR